MVYGYGRRQPRIHLLRTFCGEAEASNTPELRGGRSKDTGVAITGHPGLCWRYTLATGAPENQLTTLRGV